MIIDAHAHMMNGKFFEQMASKGGKWGTDRAKDDRAVAGRKPHFASVPERLEQLDRNNITRQVVTPHSSDDCNLLPGDIAAQLAYARVINDGMAALMEESKGRLIAAGAIPMGGFEKGSRQEMERAIKTLGLKAIGIVSNIRGKPVDAPEYESFWACCAEMSVPVYIHPIDPVASRDRPYEAQYDLIHNFGWPFETTLMLARLVFSGIMERYPTLKVVSHHLGGGMIPFYMGRTLETYEPENQRQNYGGQTQPLPKPLFEYFSRFYYDTAVGGSAPAVKCAYEVFGAGQLVFASDAPWGPGSGEFRLREYPKVIQSLDIPAADKEKILAGNARRMLNLD
ncbi:MAG: amidohydrolase family protein [Chloroflexota bacterium]|nr:amidohydrolase family protein [Chloroflexota bacterium]